MTADRIRIATRRSPLAWYQAEFVRARLQAARPGLEVELVGMKTEGDRVLDRSLAAIGGKGLFVKELEQGLLDERADIAVHSMKDVPGTFPDGLHLPVVLERESPFDAFVSHTAAEPAELDAGAVVGTCSQRRASQLLHTLPGCRIRELRGNVNTRLGKLDSGDFDAVILAVAGLERLGFGERIRQALDTALCLPAIGQGALGIECRRDDPAVEDCIAALAHRDTADCVFAERAVSHALGGSCLSPIAGYAIPEGPDTLYLRARVALPDGTQLIAAEGRGGRADPAALGRTVAEDLRGRGAAELLAAVEAH